MKLRSHAVQRSLPRPLDVNENILRNVGSDDPPLSELQKVGRHCPAIIKRFSTCQDKLYGKHIVHLPKLMFDIFYATDLLWLYEVRM